MDMRDYRGMPYRDGRRLPPRNSRGEFRKRRSRRSDRSMDYDMSRNNMRGDMRNGYGRDMRNRGYDRNMDGHYYPQDSTYYPVEAMGTFNGYYGMPEQDYGYDMRGYDMRGYDRDYYGDYGETLTENELDEWCHKLKEQLDEREKQMFSKEAISQKARQMGKQMDGFGEKELEVATLMAYTDYKQTIGQNPDLAIKLAFDWLTDKDVAVKGAEKLAVYYDCIVMGQDD